MANTLCWYCANACCGGCSWSKSFKPVDGWIAMRNDVSICGGTTESYFVFSCPQFVKDRDPERPMPRKKVFTVNRKENAKPADFMPIVERLHKEGYRNTDIARKANVSPSTVTRALERLRCGRNEYGFMYVCYDSETGHLVAEGTAEECAKVTGLNARTIYKCGVRGDGKYRIMRVRKREYAAMKRREEAGNG